MSGPTISPSTAVRLQLKPEGEQSGHLDGAWWPRTSDLDVEAAALIEAVDQRGPRTVRLNYGLAEWTAPHRTVQIGAHKVRLDGFNGRPPHLVHLTDRDATVTTLLVVPADTDEATARQVMDRATTSHNQDTPAVLLGLDTTTALPDVGSGAGTDSTVENWTSEGGQPAG